MPNQPVTRLDREIGARIRAARREVGMSGAELGKLVGMSAQGLVRWELGQMRVRASALVAFAKALKKPVGYFYGD